MNFTSRFWKQPSSALSGTFSHCFATGEGTGGEGSLLPSAGWEKVADRPDEGAFNSRGASCS